MILTLGDCQKIFAQNTGKLIVYIYEQGYAMAYGEAYRSNEQAIINSLGEAGRMKLAELIQAVFPALASAIKDNGKANGVVNTAHGQKLAIDLSLFKNNVYLMRTEDYRSLGAYWKSLHSQNRWGGDFTKKVGDAIIPNPDGNHFSMEYGGIA